MNQKVLKQYNVEFYKRAGQKFLNSEVNWLSTFIYIYRDSETVDEFIADLELAITDNVGQIADPDWSGSMGSYWHAYITPSGMEIWQDMSDRTVIPLQDMKEILISWREFLEKS